MCSRDWNPCIQVKALSTRLPNNVQFSETVNICSFFLRRLLFLYSSLLTKTYYHHINFFRLRRKISLGFPHPANMIYKKPPV